MIYAIIFAKVGIRSKSYESEKTTPFIFQETKYKINDSMVSHTLCWHRDFDVEDAGYRFAFLNLSAFIDFQLQPLMIVSNFNFQRRIYRHVLF